MAGFTISSQSQEGIFQGTGLALEIDDSLINNIVRTVTTPAGYLHMLPDELVACLKVIEGSGIPIDHFKLPAEMFLVTICTVLIHYRSMKAPVVLDNGFQRGMTFQASFIADAFIPQCVAGGTVC